MDSSDGLLVHGHDEVDTHYHMSSTMYITRKEAIDLEIKDCLQRIETCRVNLETAADTYWRSAARRQTIGKNSSACDQRIEHASK